MATDINQYKNSPVYGSPKQLATGKTFRSDAPITQNNKPTGKHVSEVAPINSGK